MPEEEELIKISELPELITAEDDDVFPIVDISTGITKKIQKSNLIITETDPIFDAWLTATPPIYSETDPVYSAWDKSTGIQIAETQITDGSLLARLAANETIAGNWIFTNDITITNKSRARAYRATSSQVIPHNTITKVQLNAESYDTQGEFDSTTNYRFTATKAGYYLVICHASLEGIPLGILTRVYVYKNGTSFAQGDFYTSLTDAANPKFSDIIYLAVNDYLEMYILHNKGSDVNLWAGESLNFMSVHKLS